MDDVGITPDVVDVPAKTPDPGFPFKSNMENGIVATRVLGAIFDITIFCLN